MTIEQIKAEMKQQGLSIQQMADKLGVNYDSLRLILSGVRPLKEQLSRHIDFVLGAAKTQVFLFTVDLPEATARVWAPGWEKLTEEEKQKAAAAVGQASAEALARRGEALLTPQEQELLKGTKQPGGGAATVGAAAPHGTTSADYGGALAPMA